MLEIDFLRTATRHASLGLVLLCLAACGGNDGDADDVTASLPSTVHGAAGTGLDAGGVLASDSGARSGRALLANAPTPLVTPTYDGSGQAVEPTVLYFPGAWRGHHYWMAMSPYPVGNARFENPSVLVSEDGLSWSVPTGLENPVVRPGAAEELADWTLVYDDTSDELWGYYLAEVKDRERQRSEFLYRITSTDGVHWSLPLMVLAGMPYHMESPTVVKTGGEFRMWTVNVGPGGCATTTSVVQERTSVDGVQWSPPVPVGIEVPGFVVWHLNVTQVPGTQRLLAAVTAFRENTSCNTTRLFLTYGDDDYGDDQAMATYPKPLLVPGKGLAWDDHAIYRSSLIYDPQHERLRLWYSARHTTTNVWHFGYTEGTFQLPQ
jgi:hypothetical protein